MKTAHILISFLVLTLSTSCIGFQTSNKKIAIKGVNLNEKSGPINGYDYYGGNSPRIPSNAPSMKKEKTSKNTKTNPAKTIKK